MKDINETLKAKKLNEKDLSQELQQDVRELKEMVVKYNMAFNAYESNELEDTDTEKNLDEQHDFIHKMETDLCEKIKSYEKPEPKLEQEPELEPKLESKKDSSVGWLIFGGLVFIVTLGAVNAFKK
jgi:hypothetical protein